MVVLSVKVGKFVSYKGRQIFVLVLCPEVVNS